MACETKDREIQGRKYVVTQMVPSHAIPIKVLLGQILLAVGPSLLSQFKQVEDLDTGMSLVASVMPGVGLAIEKHLPPEEFLALAMKLASPEYVRAGPDGAPINFEVEFSGDDLRRLYPVLAFIVEVNYAGLFTGSGFGALMDLAKAKYQSAISSASPPTST